MMRWVACLLYVSMLCASAAAPAQTRAWLDRDRIGLDETVALNIESDDALAAAPDYTALQRDFALSGNTSSRQVQIVNGRSQARTLFAVALQPRREGLLTVPALKVGTRMTQPLSLTVTAAAPPARAGGDAFIEAEADDQNPYVQQAVGFVLRLYYATAPVSGELVQDVPDGASLQRVGDDLQYMREVGGRRYTVVERRFLLTPERSGPITIPGARFRGRAAGGFFDDMFGDGQRELRANAAPRFLDVRALPAHAPQPWLPLRGLTLRYLDTPQQLRAGAAATLVVEAVADGANAAQMPALSLDAADGMQVFADPAQSDERFDNGRPQVKITRRFSIVPTRAGTLRIAGPRIGWWDVRAGIARSAALPDLSLAVAPAAATPSASGEAGAVQAAPPSSGMSLPGLDTVLQPWALATMAFALLWLGTLAWALQRRAALPSATASMQAGSDARPPAGVDPRALRHSLRQLLDSGDPGDIADTLCALASPPAADLDTLQARLADPAQQAAVAQLQRARWGDGDMPAARAALRAAFQPGPRWRTPADAAPEPLPPLYPRG